MEGARSRGKISLSRRRTSFSIEHYFDGDEGDVVYAREDVADEYTDEEIEAIFDDLFLDSFGKAHQEAMYVHGELNCIVRFFDAAIELHFPHGEMSGTAVAVDPQAVADIEGLIDACLNELHSEYPPATV